MFSKLDFKKFGGSIGYNPITTGEQGKPQGGFYFDLPLSSVASVINQSLSYTQANSQNNRNFFSQVVGRSQSNVNNTADRAFEFNQNAMVSLQKMQADAMHTARQISRNKSGCFITTAICQLDGKPDDCEELTILREYRDEWLVRQPAGQMQVAFYYETAPEIVDAINELENAETIYTFLRDVYLDPAIVAIKQERYDDARDIYSRMVGVALRIAGLD